MTESSGDYPSIPTTHPFGRVTGERLGFRYGAHYKPKEVKKRLSSLRDYSAYMYNFPNFEKKYANWVRGQQLGLSPQAYFEMGEELFPVHMAESTRELSDVEKYIYGQSDIAPEGYEPISVGQKPFGGGEGVGMQWFKERYPKISGRQRSGEWASYNWRDILEGRAKFAPRIQTLRF